MSEQGVVFLEGFKTVLRPPEAADIEAFRRWMNDPAIRQFLGQFLPQSERMEREWLEKIGKSESDVTLAVLAKPECPLIGSMGLHRIEWKNRIATTGAIIGDPAYHGKGYGTDAKMALLEYAFHELGLNKINSAVLYSNPRSIAYSMKCGYKIEGRRRQQVFKRGRFIDLVELGVLRREWEPIWRRWKKTGSVK